MSVCEHLRCPSCRAAMQPAGRDAAASAGTWGILTCQCAEHPIVDGIVCVNDAGAGWQEGPRVLDRLKRGRPDLALAEALLGSYRHVARRVVSRLERAGVAAPAPIHNWLCRAMIRRLCGDGLTFERAARLLRKREYARYLVQRWAIPSHHAAIPLILLLGVLRWEAGLEDGHADGRADGRRHHRAGVERPVRVLEIGCGAGHACALMRRYHPEHEVILTDGDFGNLWLARRFVAPDAGAYVRANAERTLPFVGSSMDAIFCCDAFHFIRNQEGLASELDRVTRPEGVWLLAHLHNALLKNITPGRARTPQEWAECLGQRRKVCLAAESRILREFIEGERLDLSARDGADALAACNALSAISGPEALWRLHELGAAHQDGDVGLDVNPAYAISRGRHGRVRLRRRRFGGLLGLESGAATHLPRELEIQQRLLDGLRRGRTAREDEATLAELRRLMVVTPRVGTPRLRTARPKRVTVKHTREDSNLRPAV